MKEQARPKFRADQLGSQPRSRARSALSATAHRVPVLAEGYRFLKAPSLQSAIRRDLAVTRRDARWIRELPSTGADAPVALAVCLSDQLFDVKLRMLTATALKAAGWRIAVLSRGRASLSTHRYCRAFGVDEVLLYDEFRLSRQELTRCEEATSGFLARDVLSFQEVKEWRFRDAWIGPQLLSTVSRRLLQGAPDLADPEVRDLVFLLLPEMLHEVIRTEHVLAAVGADLVLVDEHNYSVMGPLVDVAIARGAKVITTRPMLRDNALMSLKVTTETRRTHHAAVSAESLDELSARVWTDDRERALTDELEARYSGTRAIQRHYQAAGTVVQSKQEVVGGLGMDVDKKVAVIFSHVLWDANLFYGEDLFENFGDWLVQSVAAACKNDSVNWLVKLHPSNLTKRGFHGSARVDEVELIEQHVGPLPAHVSLVFPDTDVSTLSLYRWADVGITVRGTPGVEMPCFGRPVLTAGTGRYSGLGFTVDSATREEYLDRLAHVQDHGPLAADEVQRAKWYAYALFKLRSWNIRSFELDDDPAKSGTVLARNVRIVATSVEEARKFGDLDRWAEWATTSPKWDYLERED